MNPGIVDPITLGSPLASWCAQRRSRAPRRAIRVSNSRGRVSTRASQVRSGPAATSIECSST
jgi:hypothetical protein